MGSIVEGRELQKNGESVTNRSSHLAGRLLRSLSALRRELFAKVGLRGTESGPCRLSGAFRRLAASRHHSRSDALDWSRYAFVIWSRHPLVVWSRHAFVPE